MIALEDNGIGIGDEERERVFEPFVTTKGPAKGTGLGLSISKKIVERQGGLIVLDPGTTGATFRVILPRGDSRAAAGDGLELACSSSWSFGTVGEVSTGSFEVW